MTQGKSHEHSYAAPHGNQIEKIGADEADLVVKGTELTLYLVGKEEEVPLNGFEATALVLAEKGQKPVALKLNGSNKLAGAADFTCEGKVMLPALYRPSR